MKDRLHLRLQIHPDHRLGDPVGHRGDGYFILPFLQSCVGIGSFCGWNWAVDLLWSP